MAGPLRFPYLQGPGVWEEKNYKFHVDGKEVTPQEFNKRLQEDAEKLRKALDSARSWEQRQKKMYKQCQKEAHRATKSETELEDLRKAAQAALDAWNADPVVSGDAVFSAMGTLIDTLDPDQEEDHPEARAHDGARDDSD